MILEKPEGGSVWDDKIFNYFASHIESEEDLLASYGELADETRSEHVRYLVRLILEDEARHHRLFIEMANALRSAIELRPIDPRVPPLDRESHAEKFLKQTERFLKLECEDAQQLQKLLKELRPMRGSTLWSLLLELMTLDTEKHIRILRFLYDHARRSL